MKNRILTVVIAFLCLSTTVAIASETNNVTELENKLQHTWKLLDESTYGLNEKNQMVYMNIFSRTLYDNDKMILVRANRKAYDVALIELGIQDLLGKSSNWSRAKYLQSRPAAMYSYATTLFNIHMVFGQDLRAIGCKNHSFADELRKDSPYGRFPFAQRLSMSGLMGNIDDSCSGTITSQSALRPTMEFANGVLRSVEMPVGENYGVKIRFSNNSVRVTHERNNTYLTFTLDHQKKEVRLTEYYGPLSETEERSALARKDGRAVKITNTQQMVDPDITRAAETLNDLYPSHGAITLAKLLTPVAAEQVLRQSRLDHDNAGKQPAREAEMADVMKHFEFSGFNNREAFMRYLKAISVASRVWQIPYCTAGATPDDVMPKIMSAVKQYDVTSAFPAHIKAILEYRVRENELMKQKFGADYLCYSIKNIYKLNGLTPEMRRIAEARLGENIEQYAAKRAAVYSQVNGLTKEINKAKAVLQ